MQNRCRDAEGLNDGRFMNANSESQVTRRYRSVWISDVHLGTRHAQVNELLDFLRETDCRYLYLVGDFIDGWQLKSKIQS